MSHATTIDRIHEVTRLLEEFHCEAKSLEERIENGDEYTSETCQYARANALWEYAEAILKVATSRGSEEVAHVQSCESCLHRDVD